MLFLRLEVLHNVSQRMTCPNWALFRAGECPKVPDAPYPTHYRRAFAFSDILSPLGRRSPLRGFYRRMLIPDPMGVTAFRHDDTEREGASFRPPIMVSLSSQWVGEQPIGSPFGSGLSASFDLSTIHGPSDGGSREFSLRPSLVSGPPDAGRPGSRLAGRSAPEGEGTLSLPLQTRPLPVAPGQVGYPSGRTGFSS